VSGCRREAKGLPPDEQTEEAKDRWAIDSARREADIAAAAAPGELSGSIWRLVRLQSLDGTVLEPEPRAVYTVEFGSDGKAGVVGGCNRGNGTWTVAPPSGLTFGPLATTRAMCPPGSMSERFLGDFQNMRSYQLVGGHLYISLAADGGVYDFVPEETAGEKLGAGTAEPEVVFACTDSTGAPSRIHAKFAGNTAELSYKRNTVVLPQVSSASGARYEGKGVMFWNKGRAAMVTWQGANLNCATSRE
jgi:heat shock protein HslJ/membrane-bound inhibitor of C-type lysozyme